ncbi:MAG: aldehyde dehydrogenase family protein [Gammaproteobacteria bacterium]|jgi:aldehyde dehydrogenase (NAD+)|nr:aldehyde dehydrogenase family protein [Gammaproteobacteria bacterium]MCP4880373.1 aldehyde dehydrogenase family protein [Gammaproteobacteria bacterium]MDP6165785.1 aldehyde dehydrogenase family protein [Gammaproteobacteria bacterium]
MTLMDSFTNLEYSSALESSVEAKQWLAAQEGHFGHFINGSWQSMDGADQMPVTNPATAEQLAIIELASADDVDAAVSAAQAALPAWQKLGGMGRAKVLYALARGLQKHTRLFAVLETLDNGKPIRESRDADVPLAVRHFYHHAGWAKLQEQVLPGYQAVGVVGQIIPWNFPLLMLAWKIAPALAMGNTLVLKPAEQTPLTAMLFAHLCEQAGVPPGVVNIINGAGATGSLLAAHTGVNKVAFTGSTPVGKSIRQATAGQGKKLSLELGGKSAFVVFEDADLDAAVEGIVDAIWFNQGEVCCAGSRLLVQANVEQALIAKLKQRMQTLTHGNPLDKSIDVGAMVSEAQFRRVKSMVTQGLESGGDLYQVTAIDESTNYYPPSLITSVETSHPLVQSEIFGPVLVVMSFRTQAEAVELSNNSVYGLAASVWSENINRALDVAPKLQAGVVWINNHNQFDAACGFGGVKESGYGREGGMEGLYEYLKPAGLQRQPVVTFEARETGSDTLATGAIDHTQKFYIGGKQVRPDAGHSRAVHNTLGEVVEWIGVGNRKDIRNAVGAAVKSHAWSASTGHLRAQILYYMAENLSLRESEWVARLQVMTGQAAHQAEAEFHASLARLFSYAGWADKYDGLVHDVPYRGVTMALPEPKGVIAIVAPEQQPLLSCISLIGPALAMGNRIVLVPSERFANLALDLVQVLETSDIPAGVVNIVTGPRKDLAIHLAGHAEIDGIWCWADTDTVKQVEFTSAEDLKTTWCHDDFDRDWMCDLQGEGREFLRQATEVKNIWAPYGD